MSLPSPDYDKSYEGRKLYFQQHDGVLATISRQQDIKGFPLGSVVPFCLDRHSSPLILISELSQHYKNIEQDPRVSLTLREPVSPGDDVQSHARLSYLGICRPVSDDQLQLRYIRYLPQAARYLEAHSFHLYQIEMIKARFIGGFGKIFWLDPSDLLLDNPFDEKSEALLLDQMNQNHPQALQVMLARQYRDLPSSEPLMVGVDALGCDIRAAGRLYRIWFDTPVQSTKEARQQFRHLEQS